MGYQTVVTILNDCWPEYERNPERLVADINEGRAALWSNRYGPNGLTVIAEHHASDTCVCISGGNTGCEAGRDMGRQSGWGSFEWQKGVLNSVLWWVREQLKREKAKP